MLLLKIKSGSFGIMGILSFLDIYKYVHKKTMLGLLSKMLPSVIFRPQKLYFMTRVKF